MLSKDISLRFFTDVSASGDSGATASDCVLAAVRTTPDGKPAQMLPVLEESGPTKPHSVVNWELTAKEKEQLQDLLMKVFSMFFQSHFKVGKEVFEFLCRLDVSFLEQAAKKVMTDRMVRETSLAELVVRVCGCWADKRRKAGLPVANEPALMDGKT